MDLVKLMFSVATFSVMPFWVLMIAAPRWRWTERVVRSPLIVAAPVGFYAALVLPRVLALLPLVARPELPPLAAVLGTPLGATIAWAHFLALDLLAGRFVFLDARARDLPARITSPVLAATLLFAPLGLLAYAVALALRTPPLRRLARNIWAGHRPLALVTLASLGVLVFALVMQQLDPRLVGGVPTWIKPAKFGASIALTAPALAWILAQMPASLERRAHRAGTLVGVALLVELAIIVIQAARGVPSHFNNATALDGALFTLMGLGVIVLWSAEIYVAVRAFRQDFATDARTWAIRLGLVGTLLGGGIGFLMPIPTRAQLAVAAAGGKPALVGAHSVGVADGGPGLPVTRWTTEGGDLRVPHFIGLHALQVLPLVALALERRRRLKARPIVALGVGWIGLTIVALIQALRAQPLVAPDAITIATALAVVVAAAGIALGTPRELAAFSRGRRASEAS
jgi:hypothetical protein